MNEVINQDIQKAATTLIAVHAYLEEKGQATLINRKYEIELGFEKSEYKITVQKIEPNWIQKLFNSLAKKGGA